MAKSRPINLNLFTIHFPLPAIVSILHRISGVILFFMIPFLIWALDLSLTQQGFDHFQGFFISPLGKIFVFSATIPFFFHLVAGIRHLLGDIHIGDSLQGGRVASILTFIVTFILICLTGIWLW